jgi:hypothetical protein
VRTLNEFSYGKSWLNTFFRGFPGASILVFHASVEVEEQVETKKLSELNSYEKSQVKTGDDGVMIIEQQNDSPSREIVNDGGFYFINYHGTSLFTQ